MVWKNHKVPLRQRCKRCLRLHSLKTLKDSNWKNLSGMTGRPCKRTQRLWLRKKDPPGKKLSLRLTPRPWSTCESHAHTYLQQDHRFNFLQTRHQLTFIHSQNSDFTLDVRRAMGFMSPSRLVAKLNESVVGLNNSHITTANSRSMEDTQQAQSHRCRV